mgnify:CR=1 FL=1
MPPEITKAFAQDREPVDYRIAHTGTALLDHVLSGAVTSDYPNLVESASKDPNSLPTRQRSSAFLALSLVLVTATLTVAGVQQSHSHAIDSRTNAELIARVEAERTAVTETETKNSALAASNRAMAARILGQSGQGATLQNHISATGPLAAATPITGTAGCTTFLLHGGQLTDRNVHTIANLVWQSSPVGVTVGGIRLSSTSAIRTAGTQVLVAYEPVASPLTVCAAYSPTATEAMNRNFKALNRFASAIGVKVRHSISIMTLPAASDRALHIRVARAQ